MTDHERAEKAFEDGDLLASAQLGSVTAQEVLGNMFATGIGKEKDLHLAFYWLLKAANGGRAAPAFYVAEAYNYGLGVEQNHQKASEYYDLARQLGYEFPWAEIQLPKASLADNDGQPLPASRGSDDVDWRLKYFPYLLGAISGAAAYFLSASSSEVTLHGRRAGLFHAINNALGDGAVTIIMFGGAAFLGYLFGDWMVEKYHDRR